MFRIVQCRCFAGSTHHDQSIRAVFDLILDQPLERIVIDLSVFLHRCDKSYTGSLKDRHMLFPPHE